MPWAKVDDGWWCHRKTMGLPLPSAGLWALALSWSCAQRSPVVPPTFLAVVGATEDDAAVLVDRGLWIVVDDGWQFHDWAEYQELSVSEKRAEAGRKGGQRSKPVTSTKVKQTEANVKQTDKQDAVASLANEQAGALPVPAPPVPSRPNENRCSISGEGSPPAEPVTVEPPPKLTGRDLDNAAARSLLRYSHKVARRRDAFSPDGLAAAIRKDAATDGTLATLTAWIADGMAVEDAADRLADDGTPTHAEQPRPRLRPVGEAPPCEGCQGSGRVLDDDDVAHRCPICNPSLIALAEAELVARQAEVTA